MPVVPAFTPLNPTAPEDQHNEFVDTSEPPGWELVHQHAAALLLRSTRNHEGLFTPQELKTLRAIADRLRTSPMPLPPREA